MENKTDFQKLYSARILNFLNYGSKPFNPSEEKTITVSYTSIAFPLQYFFCVHSSLQHKRPGS